MTNYALLLDGQTVHEVIAVADGLTPGKDIYTAAMAEMMVLCPAGVAAGWTTADGGKTFAAPVAPTVDLRAYAANARFAKETGGITVGNAPIATDRDSQALITGAALGAQMNPNFTAAWKTTSGFVTINAAQINAIATAVLAHVQACFAAESQVDAGITAGTITTTAQVDAAFAAVTV